jgi:hypothetical protein
VSRSQLREKILSFIDDAGGPLSSIILAALDVAEVASLVDRSLLAAPPDHVLVALQAEMDEALGVYEDAKIQLEVTL